MTPGGPMPVAVSGLQITSWQDQPASSLGWEALAASNPFSEPPFNVPQGKHPAAGAVILETDGRVWMVSPSNGFGGYTNTFPKGRVEQGLSMKASAIKEAAEETGLKVELTGFLCDVPRSTTHTRYFAARRVGGNPADMGWETQAVHLVPRPLLPQMAANSNDKLILVAISSFQMG
ncbi:hypothetical protein GCM10027034_20110 [Ramlibacter solisilvae]